MEQGEKKFDLEERLIDFTIAVFKIAEQLPDNRIANHIEGQLIRSCSSPSLNYSEAKSAESKNDFIHKMKVCLKELRETLVCLKIIKKKPLVKSFAFLDETMIENNELISIFVKA